VAAVRLGEAEARSRLASASHGVLCTVHPTRGVDAVPVMYAVDDELVGVPIDTVKPKGSTRLQRERNLEADPRATLLVEHWDAEDWSALWWVRAQLRPRPAPDEARREVLAGRLASQVPQYRERPFAQLLVLRIVDLTGWTASERHTLRRDGK
jgi:hypothetical protein